MDFPTALLRDLLDLSASVDHHGDELSAGLTGLVSAMRVAVPSYRGLSLTLYDNEQPVSLTSFLPAQGGGEITTSLRLPFAAVSPGFDSQSRVVFYAATPGSFVDLAADLGHALRASTISHELRGPHLTKDPDVDGQHGDGQHGDGDREGPDAIVLDADLPPHTLVSRLTGLDDASTINRAVGMLIDEGHHPDDAHATLRRHAAAAGVDTQIYAARLLRR